MSKTSKPDMEIQLPFDGYYESVWSQGLDWEMESYAENCEENERETYGRDGLDASDFNELLFDAMDHRKAERALNESVIDAMMQVLDDELDIKITLKDVQMESPKFYNFTTDRLFCKISRDDVAKLVRIVRSDRYETLREVLKERHTSYDGFCSFYSNDLSRWLSKPVSQWDHNELESLLLAAAETRANQSKFGCARGRELWTHRVYETVVDCDSMIHEFEAGMDWDKFERACIERRTEKFAEIEAETGEKPEPRCTETKDLFRA